MVTSWLILWICSSSIVAVSSIAIPEMVSYRYLDSNFRYCTTLAMTHTFRSTVLQHAKQRSCSHQSWIHCAHNMKTIPIVIPHLEIRACDWLKSRQVAVTKSRKCPHETLVTSGSISNFGEIISNLDAYNYLYNIMQYLNLLKWNRKMKLYSLPACSSNTSSPPGCCNQYQIIHSQVQKNNWNLTFSSLTLQCCAAALNYQAINRVDVWGILSYKILGAYCPNGILSQGGYISLCRRPGSSCREVNVDFWW